MTSRGVSLMTALAVGLALSTSCGSGHSSEVGGPGPATPDSRYPSSIAAIGHSGLTGYNSDPSRPSTDVTANSWATGTNPAVDSIYQRVLAMNPAVEGHATDVAIDGSTVDSLLGQEAEAAKVRPAPDLVLVQSIDNDVKCDGTDPQNYGPYREKLTAVLDAVDRDLSGAQIFFVSQWASVKEYDRVVMTIDPDHIAGTGPCDPVDPRTGRVDPKHERYLQSLVDHYWTIISEVCAKYSRCRTDGGVMQTMRLGKGDLAGDLDHLSMTGQHKMAAMIWSALNR
ncbi:MAG: lipolytic protein family [Marmoricola sp.]|nr:lipolytic protein family [Marmoricola sp.]